MIHKMTASDLPDVNEIERTILGYKANDEFLSETVLHNSMAHYYIYKIQDKTVGFAGLWITNPNADIINIAVLEAYWRQGIAQALMDTLLELCGEYGVENVTLEVRVDNDQAIHFYEKNGFYKETIRKNYYQDATHAYLMVKKVGR